MKSRTTRGNSDKVSLFPFLAVLLCTMGALLVLLVVLAQKAKEQALDEAVQHARTAPRDLSAAEGKAAEETRQLEQQLQQLHRYQQQLATLRAEAESRQRDEQLRLSHAEEHSRRLEHELAKLYLASEQLKATEETQIVDQEQAERELARLNNMIEEGQQELEALREQSRGKRSYAIIPYRGPQGTVRRPIYVECSKEGVVIQPEGIRLTAKDFIAPFDSGNPLAKALRAARDLLNTRAARAGESEPPDPYPLLVVRPDGIQQYAAARTAIESWDADFGYEFINKQWTLQYPETDPELAQAMRHAVMQGRERIAMLIQAAPRRYGRLGISTSLGRHGTGGHSLTGVSADGDSTGSGWDSSATPSASSHTATDREGDSGGRVNGQMERNQGKDSDTVVGTGTMGSGTHFTKDTNTSDGHLGVFTSAEGTEGAQDGSPVTTGPTGNFSGRQNTREAPPQGTSTPRGSTGYLGRYGESIQSSAGTGTQPTKPQFANPGNAGQFAAGGTSSGQAGFSGASSTSTGGSSFGSSSAHGSEGNRNGKSSAQARGGTHTTSGSPESKVSSRGNNWALRKPQHGAVPIRRPIKMVIRQDRMAILQSRHAVESSSYEEAMISLNQSTEQIKEELATALRKHMQEWGLAGNGLYWRPVLQLNVGPRGQQQATRLSQWLEGSGIEIDRSHTARRSQEVPTQATR